MPTKEFWNWQRSSKLCRDCTEEPKDCMRCEIVWDAALQAGVEQRADNKQSTKPWLKANECGEMPGDICCQRAIGKYCYEHDPVNYK